MKKYNIPRIKMSYVSDSTRPTTKITGSADAAAMFRQTYEPGEIEMQEYFKVMYLNQAHKVIGVQTVAMGGTTMCAVDAKIIFGGALTAKATAIVLCHNHPSGNARPSIKDDQLTRKLRDGAKLLDIQVLDHIILTSESHFSFSDDGRI